MIQKIIVVQIQQPRNYEYVVIRRRRLCIFSFFWKLKMEIKIL